MLKNFIFKTLNLDIKTRIDVYLLEKLNKYASGYKSSRCMIHKYIKDQCVYKIDDQNVHSITDKNYKMKEGEIILFLYSPKPVLQKICELEDKEKRNIEIVYEDDDLIVVNKPSNLVVHPEPKYQNYSLVHLLKDKLSHFKNCNISIQTCEKSNDVNYIENDSSSSPHFETSKHFRPGIVHRLDKDTSGLMMVAKNEFSLFNLSDQIKVRKVKRTYQALVHGILTNSSGTISTFITRDPKDRLKMKVSSISGKLATTHYKLLEVFEHCKLSLVECNLETGRTHQIRVHMKHIGYPVVGDQSYGKLKFSLIKDKNNLILSFPRQALHATQLHFSHPVTNKILEFKSALPDDIQSLIDQIKMKN